MTGDLTSVFDFAGARPTPPRLPSTADAVAKVDAARQRQLPVAVFDGQVMPVQEPGQRLARALPYVLDAWPRVDVAAAQPVTLVFDNLGSAGAHFSVHSAGAVAGPWAYSVEPAQSLTSNLPGLAASDGAYDLSVHGPNGFFRRFQGGMAPDSKARPEVRVRYDDRAGALILVLSNTGSAACAVSVRPTAYLNAPARTHQVAPGATLEDRWTIAASAHWYDFTVTVDGDPHFERRVAGHMETGAPSLSDPLIGANTVRA